MEQKQSKIVECTFHREHAGQKGTIFYHNIKFENGDFGQIGTKNKNPDKLQKGMELKYTIERGPDYQGQPQYKIKAIYEDSRQGNKYQRNENRITFLSCLGAAATLYQQSQQGTPENVLAAANKFYEIAITKND